MSKIRVYELARDMKIESKLLMNTLKSVGISVPSHQSMLTDEQIEQVKKAISGEAVKEGSQQKSVVTRSVDSSSSSVRVIRRRRGPDAEDAPVEEPAPPAVVQAAELQAPEQEVQAQQVVQTPPVEAAPAQEVPEQVVKAETPPVQEAPRVTPPSESKVSSPASTAPRPGPSAPSQPQPRQESYTTNRSFTSNENRSYSTNPNRSYSTNEGRSYSTNSSNETRSYSTNEGRSYSTTDRRPPPPGGAIPPRRPQSGGATIVRKATPEEIQMQNRRQEQQQQQQQRSGSRPFARREDSRGTKYTGFGTQPRLEIPDTGTSIELTEEATRAARRVKDKRSKEVEEKEKEEEAKKVVAKGGARRSGYNMRQLLSEIEEFDPNAEEPADIAAPVEEEVRIKTIYTPNSNQRRRDLKRRKDLKKTEITVARQSYRIVKMGENITVGELAHQLKIKASDIIKKLMDQGVMVSINQAIDFDTATILSTDYGYEVKSNLKSIDEILGTPGEDNKNPIGDEERSPIVTVMGHVDHGKTSILDAIRKTDVAAKEAGGITQHIGAYSIQHDGRKVTFLDTPGHEAFSAMRARGADVTDIVVLVVAADDGVMPQTVEAISHARAAKVPMIVAVNKIDKESANIDRIYRELSEQQVIAEEWGGDTQFVKVSALTKVGINQLLESILVQADVLELKTSSSIPAVGAVVEAHLDQGRGPIATVLVKDGTLRNGDYIVAGAEFGRVRAMYDYLGKKVDAAGPSTPVEVLGLSGVPRAGDRATVVKDERTAREAVSWALENQKSGPGRGTAQTLEELLGRMKEAETPELAIIVKGDTQGSVEAISESLAKLNSERVRNRVIHKAVGGISESDITLAEASKAVIVGFSVRAGRGLQDEADKRGVVINYFSIIYDLVDSVKALMAGKLPSIIEEVVIGRAEVRQSIQVPKVGTIAGVSVTDGRIARNSGLRLIRDDVVIYTGKISSLRRFKDDVKEVKIGYECGIGLENYNDIHIGDVLEAFEVKETRPTL